MGVCQVFQILKMVRNEQKHQVFLKEQILFIFPSYSVLELFHIVPETKMNRLYCTVIE